MHRPALLMISYVAASCAGGLPEVVDSRNVPAARGAPRLKEVVDLPGAGMVPSQGRVASGPAVGRAVIGQLLLLRGSSFGKQPTVTIGGRATEVLAHVEEGGVLVRVPWGIDPGAVEVEVSNESGRHALTFPVRRLGLVASGRTLQLIEVKPDGSVALAGEVELPAGARVRHLAFSTDGSAAYLAGEDPAPRVWTVDLSLPVPRVVGQEPLPGTRVLDLAAAERAPLALVVTDTHLTFLDTSEPNRPVPYAPHVIPAELVRKKILAAAMNGEGNAVALLLSQLNALAVIPVPRPSEPGKPILVDLLPETRLPVVKDLACSADGRSIWVASGASAASIKAGAQPLRMTLLQVGAGKDAAPTLSVHRTWDLAVEEAPISLALARGEPIPPGTAIRPEPSTSAVYLTSYPGELLGRSLEGAKPAGSVLRSGLDQAGQRLLGGVRIFTSLDVVGKTQVLLALGGEQLGGRWQRVLLSRRAWSKDAPRVLSLGPLDAELLRRVPPALGEVRAQP